MTVSKLFTPIQVGPVLLNHRVVLAPLTRFRANSDHSHSALAVEYYSQRASVPGTLLITEATLIAPQAGGYQNVPGIWSDAQVAAWKPVGLYYLSRSAPSLNHTLQIVDAIHARGSFVFLQLWALGRAALPEVLQEEGPHPYVAPSDIKRTDRDIAPRSLTTAGKCHRLEFDPIRF